LIIRRLLAVAPLVSVATLKAQQTTRSQSDPRPIARAALREGSINIDGHLDEAAWAKATPITEFVQSMPDEGKAPTERTEEDPGAPRIFDPAHPDRVVVSVDSRAGRLAAEGWTEESEIEVTRAVATLSEHGVERNADSWVSSGRTTGASVTRPAGARLCVAGTCGEAIALMLPPRPCR